MRLLVFSFSRDFACFFGYIWRKLLIFMFSYLIEKFIKFALRFSKVSAIIRCWKHLWSIPQFLSLTNEIRKFKFYWKRCFVKFEFIMFYMSTICKNIQLTKYNYIKLYCFTTGCLHQWNCLWDKNFLFWSMLYSFLFPFNRIKKRTISIH